MKKCSKCKIEKLESEFGKDKSSKSGLRSQCKKCVSDYNKTRKPKKVTYICEGCNKVITTDYYSNKKRQTSYCYKCCSKHTQTGIKKPHLSGENSGRWKGGSYISTDGYKMIKCDGEFHESGRQKYKREHILVMEEYLGRELKTERGHMGEQVHHIDGNKLNNEIENLLFCPDTQYHKKVDCQLHELAFKLVQDGLIKFDHDSKKYFIDKRE